MLFTIYTAERRENRYYSDVGLMCYIGAEYKMRNLLSDPGTVIEMLHAVNVLPLGLTDPGVKSTATNFRYYPMCWVTLRAIITFISASYISEDRTT